MTVPLVVLAAVSLFVGFFKTVPTPLFQALLPLFGVGAAALFFWPYPHTWWEESSIALWWRSGWGFDALYDRVIVRPVVLFFRWNAADGLAAVNAWVCSFCSAASDAVRRLQNGGLCWYAMTMTAGAILLISAMVWA